MEELEEDFEILIVAWLQSDDDNATNLAHSLSELAKKRALILPVVVRQSEQLVCDILKGTKCNDSFPSYKDGKCYSCGGQAN